jgi:hypothetical protein
MPGPRDAAAPTLNLLTLVSCVNTPSGERQKRPSIPQFAKIPLAGPRPNGICPNQINRIQAAGYFLQNASSVLQNFCLS